MADAIANPRVGRLADRIGARRVLTCTSLPHAVTLGVLVLVEPLPLLVGVSALAGATYPPLTRAIRDACTRLAPSPHTALTADASLFELVHVGGRSWWPSGRADAGRRR